MADTAHTPTAQDSAASRQIRVFLSSTFRDFMEERDQLVKQVFPSLRRRAQERGVDVVDVDLRWGVTQEESEQGKVIGICLAEIGNCRPYFIGMLGERYGWIPPEDKYPAVVLEQQAWLQQHLGGASVTELEILHGVLNDPKMAGRAFFYFRDPAWSRAQREPGFVCDTPEEEAKLVALKERILASNFPVKQGLADPKAIADQIEADLWALIEEQYPDLDQADALEREARKHASYRQSRVGVYLGQHYVNQLETLVRGGEQKILITGESGSGKSALIANWIHQHEQKHPGDVVYAHHLGCSNDANAIGPLLGRMLDTASKLLKEANLISEPIQAPQDLWELTAKVAETLQDLGRWCRKTGHRWIWVLDGLDRLAEDDQQALPWLPLLIPEGVSVLISALECPAKAIVQERQFQLLEIGPLQRAEQEQLIETYLERYTKKLEPERKQQILNCELATSPLFLRVLLEELRQCGRFETLREQIEDYIMPKADGSLEVSDLYERVLERLEKDCGVEVVRKVMTALWASRAGLSESELLGITGLAPLQWAPIDLALEQALGRNGNQLVFGHDYLHRAVQARYLPTEEQRRHAHCVLAEWFEAEEGWGGREAEELPWQLAKGQRNRSLIAWLSDPWNICILVGHRNTKELSFYWEISRGAADAELDDLIRDSVMREIGSEWNNQETLLPFLMKIGDALDELGLQSNLCIIVYEKALLLAHSNMDSGTQWMTSIYTGLGNAYLQNGLHERADALLRDGISLGHFDSRVSRANLLLTRAKSKKELGQLADMESLINEATEILEAAYGKDSTYYGEALNVAGVLYAQSFNHEKALQIYVEALKILEPFHGSTNASILSLYHNIGTLHTRMNNPDKAKPILELTLEGRGERYGETHPLTLNTKSAYATCLQELGDYTAALMTFSDILEKRKTLLGIDHPSTLKDRNNLAVICNIMGDHETSLAYYIANLQEEEKLYGRSSIQIISTYRNVALAYWDLSRHEQAVKYGRLALLGHERYYGHDNEEVCSIRRWLADALSGIDRYDESIPLRRQELEVADKRDGREAPGTLISIHHLAEDLYFTDELEEAEQLYREALAGRIAALGDDDGATMASRYGLARCLSAQGRYSEAIEIRRVELAWCQANDDVDAESMLISMHDLGRDLLAAGETAEALEVLQSCLNQRRAELGISHEDSLDTLSRMLEALSALGRQEEGLVLSREAQQGLAEELGESDPEVLSQLSNQASLNMELNELEEAEQLYRRCLNGLEDALGADHPDTCRIRLSLVNLLSDQDRYEECIPLLRCELGVAANRDGRDAPSTLSSINLLAWNLYWTGEMEEAEELHREALEGRIAAIGDDSADTMESRFGLAELLSDAGRRVEAIPLRRSELTWSRRERGDLSPDTLDSINGLAIDLRETGALEEAEALFRELLEARQQVLEPSDYGIGRALGGLAKTLEEAGKLEEAAGFAQQALDHRHEHEGADAWWTNRERLDLARVLHKLGRSAEILSLLDELQESIEKLPEPDEDDQQLLVEAKELRRSIAPDDLRS